MNKGNKQSGQAPRLSSGQAVIIPVTVLMLIALSLIARATRPVKTEAELARGLLSSKQAGALADAGSEDVTYRVKRAKQYNTTEYVLLNNLIATTTVSTDLITGVKTILALGNIDSSIRQKAINLVKGDQVEFNYGMQVGAGGLSMANTSSVAGNIYSNGSATGDGNTITGSVVSAGPTGLIDNLRTSGDMYAHTISNSTVGRDAYYQNISNTFVARTAYPGSLDKATATMPISDAQIAEWEAIAATNPILTCPYSISSGTVILGPAKIACDVEISGNSTRVTLAGMVWVTGKITFKNSPTISVDSALGSNSVAIIADNPLNRNTSSNIEIQNSTTFTGSGTPGSFIFLISGNTNAESPPPGPMGGGVVAINLQNSANGAVILYSNHGKISIANSAQVKAVVGYKVAMANTAQLIYNDGLESALFDTGPGGSWNVSSWKETQ